MPNPLICHHPAHFSITRTLDRHDPEGKRTDAFGHSYFTTNPRVSFDVIQLLRYGKKPGEPGRELVQVGPIVWKFPVVEQ